MAPDLSILEAKYCLHILGTTMQIIVNNWIVGCSAVPGRHTPGAQLFCGTTTWSRVCLQRQQPNCPLENIAILSRHLLSIRKRHRPGLRNWFIMLNLGPLCINMRRLPDHGSNIMIIVDRVARFVLSGWTRRSGIRFKACAWERRTSLVPGLSAESWPDRHAHVVCS